MARIRTVKPDLADDEKLGSISRDARLLFIMMWCHSDDFGVVKGNLRWLQAQIFPYDPLKPEQFEKWVKELESIDSIRPFNANEEKFYYIKNFQKHQVINRPSKQARNPEPPPGMLTEGYGSTHGGLTEECVEEGKGKEGKGVGRERKGVSDDLPDIVPEVVLHLNTVLGTEYKADSKKTIGLIQARASQGFTLENFKTVINKKATQWRNDLKMAPFLRPETLFGTKFESYLNERAGPPLPYSDKTAANIEAAQRLMKKMEEQDGG